MIKFGASMIKFGARSAQGTNQFRRMVEDMPINVLTCNLKDFTIDYANKASIETLKQLEHVLPCKADDLVGQCIDIFHKDPSHQRRLLADPRNLPHKATIEIGGEYLDLLISAIRDDQGNYVAPMLTWAVVTEKVKADAESAQLMQMLDTMPMNVMLLDPKDFTITYVNQTSKDTLKPLQSLLPCPIDDLVGQCVDIFHSNPAHQRGILGNPKNLPHTAHIQLGDETLSLQVSAVYDKDGNYASTMLTWSIITEKVKADAEKVKADAKSAQLMQMLETMPVNVMLLEPENFTITYVNQTSKDTLKPLQSLLPCQIDDLVGQCVDIFHKNPAHQRGILGNPKNLPHTAKIKLGDETLSLRVSAVNDKDNKYAAAMLTWEVVTKQVAMAENVGEIVENVSSASTEMRSTAESMAATAEETNNQASTVAAASEQLASSIVEISRQVTQSAEIAGKAMVDAKETNDKIQSLDIAAQKIGAVVSIITDIADQTNLLALNATIEAARAGDAGKGFAVVASEVKNLANQTGKATEEISAQVEDIQAATKDSVNAIKGISETIGQVDEITTAIAAAVEEQGAATQEVTSNISGVTAASSETGAAANQVLSASDELASQSNNLKEEIAKFIGD